MPPRGGSAPITIGLAAAIALFFIVGRLVLPEATLALQLGFIPLRFAAAVEGFQIPAALTVLTSTLAHGDLLHLGLNIMMLIWCGRAVEVVLGAAPFVVLYLAGAVLAAAAHYWVEPLSPVPMIGASGAISAVVAVYAMLFSRNTVNRIGPIPAHWVRALWLAVAWTVVQWMIGFAAGGGGYAIAWAAHVGGFIAGLALTRPLLAWRYRGA